jgi:hypothetical protein
MAKSQGYKIAGAFEGKKKSVLILLSVSYTHLTLPTKA